MSRIQITSVTFLLFAALAFVCPGSTYVDSAFAADCSAENNLEETAQSFIGRCRRGKINRVFPTELLLVKVGAIRDGKSKSYRKAWKLLNDSRFKK